MRLVQLTNSRGDELSAAVRLIVETIEGWHGSPTHAKERAERLRGGTFRDSARWVGRRLTVKGVSVDVEDVDAEARRVSSFLHDLEVASLEVELNGRAYQCDVQVDGEILVDAPYDPGQWVRWQIPLWSADGRLYGPAKRILIQPSGTGVGLRWPLLGGGKLDWGMSTSERAALVNAGTADAFPIFEVHADTSSGFRITAGGRALTYAGATVSSTPVVVDARGTVTVGGSDHTSRMVERDWPSVPAGSSLTATFETLDRSPGHCWATIRDTYL